MKTTVHIETRTHTFITALLTIIARRQEPPTGPAPGERTGQMRMWAWNHSGVLFGDKKRKAHVIRWMKDEPCNRHAEWRRPVTNGHLLQCFICTKCPGLNSPWSQSRLGFAGRWGVCGDLGGNEEWLPLGKGFFLISVPFLDRDNDCTLWMC